MLSEKSLGSCRPHRRTAPTAARATTHRDGPSRPTEGRARNEPPERLRARKATNYRRNFKSPNSRKTHFAFKGTNFSSKSPIPAQEFSTKIEHSEPDRPPRRTERARPMRAPSPPRRYAGKRRRTKHRPIVGRRRVRTVRPQVRRRLSRRPDARTRPAPQTRGDIGSMVRCEWFCLRSQPHGTTARRRRLRERRMKSAAEGHQMSMSSSRSSEPLSEPPSS